MVDKIRPEKEFDVKPINQNGIVKSFNRII